MLYKDSFIISPVTFKLIQELQSLPELKDFYLVGGTSLALQIGHRNSIDIDLFCNNDFDETLLLDFLNTKFKLKEVFRRNFTIVALIENIKVDFIKHDYPLLSPPIYEDGISFLSKEDICAMKLHTIIKSGKRLKDFIDIYFLLEHFSINEMIQFFIQKYNYSNPMIAIKALSFFNDIDEEIDPPILLKPLPFSVIKSRILTAIEKPNKIF